MRRIPTFAALALSFVALSSHRALVPEAHAGTAVRLDIQGLVDRADLLIEGRVLGVRVVLDPSGRIDTEYTLTVERTLIGEAQGTRVVKLPGGVLPDGRGMLIPGLPGLTQGENVILFLSQANASGMRMLVGLAQGKLRVLTDPSGRRRLVREQGELSLVDAHTGALTEADAAAELDYAATLAEIEVSIAKKRARAIRETHVKAPAGGNK